MLREVRFALIFVLISAAFNYQWVEKAFGYRPGGQTTTRAVTTAVTVGVASAQAIATDASRSSLMMCNLSASATIFWSTGTNGAAVANGAGSIPLPALACQVFDNTQLTDSINMIASAASTPATLLTWD